MWAMPISMHGCADGIDSVNSVHSSNGGAAVSWRRGVPSFRGYALRPLHL